MNVLKKNIIILIKYVTTTLSRGETNFDHFINWIKILMIQNASNYNTILIISNTLYTKWLNMYLKIFHIDLLIQIIFIHMDNTKENTMSHHLLLSLPTIPLYIIILCQKHFEYWTLCLNISQQLMLCFKNQVRHILFGFFVTLMFFKFNIHNNSLQKVFHLIQFPKSVLRSGWE